MNIVDIIILLLLILGALSGFINGFLKTTFKFVGTIVVVVLAFLFKTPLSIFLYNNLPFTKFSGLTSLNILLYELIAFIICIIVLSVILAIIIKITGLIEKLLGSIVLGLPSKILGILMGLIQSIVVVYVILFILTIPVLKVPFINESKYANMILTKTPFMSSVMDNAVTSINKITELTKDSIDVKDSKTTNTKIIEIMLENNITNIDSIKLLVEKNKIEINNPSKLIEKYKEIK